jgi:hypothetical protein
MVVCRCRKVIHHLSTYLAIPCRVFRVLSVAYGRVMVDFGSGRGDYAVAGLVMAWYGSDREPRMPRIRNPSLVFLDLLLVCRDLPLLPEFLLIGHAVLALYFQATRVYCFVHQVPVCGECICFPEHQLCVVSFSTLFSSQLAQAKSILTENREQ